MPKDCSHEAVIMVVSFITIVLSKDIQSFRISYGFLLFIGFQSKFTSSCGFNNRSFFYCKAIILSALEVVNNEH